MAKQPGMTSPVTSMISTRAKSHFRFFDLPSELRTTILEQLVVLPKGHDFTNSHVPLPVHTGEDTGEVVLMDIFLVCLQMYQEASAIFYTQNTFRIHLGNRKACDHLVEDGRLLSAHCQDARRRIRNLTVYLKRVGGGVTSLLEPVLTDMILHGSLRNLELRVLPQGRQYQRQGRMVMGYEHYKDVGRAGVQVSSILTVYSSPWQVLLRVMGDPDLEKVELWLSREHWSVWCAYHEFQPGDGSCNENMKQKGLDWVQVDWKRLTRPYGAGRQITKVGDMS